MGSGQRLGPSAQLLKCQKNKKYIRCLPGRLNTFFNPNKYGTLYCKDRNSQEKHHSTERIELIFIISLFLLWLLLLLLPFSLNYSWKFQRTLFYHDGLTLFGKFLSISFWILTQSWSFHSCWVLRLRLCTRFMTDQSHSLRANSLVERPLNMN